MMLETQVAIPLEYQVGDQPVPGYTLIRELGRGAMGVVWLAVTDSGFEAALKIIDLQRGGGKKEYRGLRTIKRRKIRHGHLLTLFDYWLKDRDGSLIPDTEEIESSESFFASTLGSSPADRPLTATTPQSISDTAADPSFVRRSTKQPAPMPRDLQRGATFVAAGTYVASSADAGGDEPLAPKGGSLQSGEGNRPNPVQLIVAMEVGHGTLDMRQRRCQEDGKPGVPVEEALPYMEQAARGLDYLHREGIIHRDVKPGNIMLVGDVAKVCDYGLLVTENCDLKATSNAFTPLYASPEAVANRTVNARSDQYSLAVSYVELVTGRSPYTSETASAVYLAKDSGKYDLSRVRKKATRAILKRALAPSPNDRFATCTEFVRELAKSEQSRSGLAVGGLAAAVVLLGLAIAATLLPAARQLAGLGKPAVPSVDSNELQVHEPQKIPPSISAIVAAARSARLKGNLPQAADELAKAEGQTHWQLDVARLHLDMAVAAATDLPPTDEQWTAWQRTADRLWKDRGGEPMDQVHLAAIRALLFTRQDPSQVSFELPLVEEFARLGEGKAYWGAVLAAADQQKIESLYQALCQKLVHQRDRLPAAWRKEFKRLWPEPTGSLLLMTRVRERIQEEDAEAASAAERDLEEIAAATGLDSTAAHADLEETRKAIARSKHDFLVGWLTMQLANDQFLTSASARKEIVESLQSRGGTNSIPLVKLALLEAEMADLDAAGKFYSARLQTELRELVSELSGNATHSPPDWLDHARFLVARAQSARPMHPLTDGSADFHVLLDWPHVRTDSWQTPKRAEQAAQALVRLAETALPSEKVSVLQIFAVPQSHVSEALKYVRKAQELTPSAASCQAIMAALLATNSEDESDWAAVLQHADRALAHRDQSNDSVLVRRKPLVEYVAAYAASRGKELPPSVAGRALDRFAALLGQQFKHEDGPRPTDGELCQKLIEPALALSQDQYAVDDKTKAALAALWAAKGRLLERDESLNRVGEAKASEPRDAFERTMLAAHRAYGQARHWHDDLITASGYGRTLLKLPRAALDGKLHDEIDVLKAIVDKYDPTGQADDPSLRLLAGFVSWHRATTATSLAAQRAALGEAASQMMAAAEATATSDPLGLRPAALTFASTAHLRAAALTPIGAGDVARERKGADDHFASLTKTQHLLEAVTLARQTVQMVGSRLPENALIAKGNAYEELAFSCKQLENYPLAIQDYEAVLSACGERSKAHALLALGRGLYHWSRESADSELTPEKRRSLLRRAYETLTQAVDVEGAVRDQAEANRWLGLVLRDSALLGPSDLATGKQAGGLSDESLVELAAKTRNSATKSAAVKEIGVRVELMERGRQFATKAIELAALAAPEERNGYLVEYLNQSAVLAARLAALKDLDASYASRRDEIERDIRRQGRDFLVAAADPSAGVTKDGALAVLLLLESVKLPVVNTGADYGSLVLKQYEHLFEAADDQDKLVTVLLRRAAYGDSQALLDRATQVAEKIEDEAKRAGALSKCLRAKVKTAIAKLDATLNEVKAAPGGASAAKFTAAFWKQWNSDLESAFKLLRDAEQLAAQARGLDVTENLAMLRQQAATKLPRELESQVGSKLAAYRLREFVVDSRPAYAEAMALLRKRMQISGYDAELKSESSSQAFTTSALPLAQAYRDFLKPLAFLREGGLSDEERNTLSVLERKLALTDATGR